MNIILIGYRGSGKSTVGRKLAERLKLSFVDVDDLIEEREEAPIRRIVNSHGWGHFRKLERTAIDEISEGDGLVIAPGGGAVLDSENVKALRKNGLIVWLKADKQTLLKRLNQDPGTSTRRPALTGQETSEELKEVLSLREPIYEEVSEMQIDTSTLDVEAVVEEVLAAVKDKTGRV